jgi:AbiV family abortive infection protein
MRKQSLKYLSRDEIQRGVFLTFDNAEDLFFEAVLLMENNVFSRSYTFTQLATEEIGKSLLLCCILEMQKRRDEINWLEMDSMFFSHIKKSRGSIVLQFSFDFLFKQTGLQDGVSYFRDVYKRKIANVEKINDFKNDSLYVGITEGKFTSPRQVITEAKVHDLMQELLSRYVYLKMYITKAYKGIDYKVTLEEIGQKIDSLTNLNLNYKKFIFKETS